MEARNFLRKDAKRIWPLWKNWWICEKSNCGVLCNMNLRFMASSVSIRLPCLPRFWNSSSTNATSKFYTISDAYVSTTSSLSYPISHRHNINLPPYKLYPTIPSTNPYNPYPAPNMTPALLSKYACPARISKSTLSYPQALIHTQAQYSQDHQCLCHNNSFQEW